MKLFIDSSTNYLYLCLLNGTTNPTFVRSGRFDHSETLVDFLQDFLTNNNCEATDIQEIYIGRGPGSYTGIRIAGTVGKVLSYLSNAKFYSFSSLDFILAGNWDKEGLVVARTVAKKGYSYFKHATLHPTLSIEEDQYGEDTLLQKDATVLELNDEFFSQGATIAFNLLKYNLYKEESNFDYTPNYLRSVV